MISKIFSLSSGTAVYQLLVLLSFPYFALNYDISVFSEYGQYSAVLSIAAVWSVARLNQAILISKCQKDRAISLIAGSLFSILVAIISFVIVIILDLSYNLRFVPLSIIAFALFELVTSLKIVHSKHSHVSVLFLLYGIFTLLLQYLFIDLRSDGLIEAKIIGDTLLLILSLFIILNFAKENSAAFCSIKFIDVFSHLIKNKDFLIYGCSQGFISSFSRNLPLLVLPEVNTTVAGYYSLFYKIIASPIDFLAKPIRQVVLSQEFNDQLLLTYQRLMLLIYPVSLILFIAYYFFTVVGLYALVSWLENYQWYSYINIVFALTLIFSQVLLSTPIKTLMISAGLQSNLLSLELFSCIIKFSIILLTLYFFDAYTAVVMYIVAVAFVDNLFLILVSQKLKRCFSDG